MGSGGVKRPCRPAHRDRIFPDADDPHQTFPENLIQNLPRFFIRSTRKILTNPQPRRAYPDLKFSTMMTYAGPVLTGSGKIAKGSTDAIKEEDLELFCYQYVNSMQ
jgi:hypothetical protein